MLVPTLNRRVLIAGVAILAATSAAAHHGWSWTVEEQSELTGTIQEIFLGNPHAVLKVEAEDGLWTVELAPPGRTRAAGFDENAAKVGDEVTAIGNRSADPNEKRMKAVQDHRQRKDLRRLPGPHRAPDGWRPACRRALAEWFCRRWRRRRSPPTSAARRPAMRR